MLDLRNEKILNLADSKELKSGAAYLFNDSASGKNLVAKLIGDYDDKNDWRLLAEFKKMALLSAEAQIGTVYFLAKCRIGTDIKSCYVLDFIIGETLDKYLEKSEHLTMQQAQDLIHEICIGMEKAHAYGIFHNDLHNHNVMVDNFGNVKIIDFLWFNSSQPDNEKHKMDLQGFKDLVQQIAKKCRGTDQKGINLVLQACMNSTSFRGLPSKISKLTTISEELSLLNPISMDIVGSFLQSVPDEYNISEIWLFDWQEIPPSIVNMIPEEDKPTPQTESYESRKANGRISRPPSIDIRLLKITSLVQQKFEAAFFEVEKLGLMSHKTSTKGSDANTQWPPYLFNYTISFSPKFLRWKALLKDQEEIFSLSKKPMADIIFSGEL